MKVLFYGLKVRKKMRGVLGRIACGYPVQRMILAYTAEYELYKASGAPGQGWVIIS